MALNYVVERKPARSVFIDLMNCAATGSRENVKEYNPRRVESIITFEMKYYQ
ncbi:MAG TPA: hypothetical protein PK544_18005 [Spirochaetota bacterium]|nr:hypothetical protein [Spirochaetota bacterium]HPJ38807.1 hypothetical protein [Spirochaetota bacterium]